MKPAYFKISSSSLKWIPSEDAQGVDWLPPDDVIAR